MSVELVQKGRAGVSVWRADDGKTGPRARIAVTASGDGSDIALVVSLSRNALPDVQEYLAKGAIDVGRIVHVLPEIGPGPASVAGGGHAAELADQVADAVRECRAPVGAIIHVFVAAPNAFTFFLGQHRESMGRCTLYEFDFSRRVDGSYHPTFRIV